MDITKESQHLETSEYTELLSSETTHFVRDIQKMLAVDSKIIYKMLCIAPYTVKNCS